MRLLLLLFISGMCSGLYAQFSNQWHQRADFGNFGRHRATGMGIGNKAYVGTGHLNGTGVDTWYPDWWEYDPATNAWAQKADYPGNNGNGDQDIVSLPMDSVGYAGLGQWDGLGFYKYDPRINTWTQVASPPANGDFNNTFAFRIGNYGYFPALYSTNFFRYDPANDSWIQLNPLPFTTQYGIPTFAIGDKGYIKNGANFYEYNPGTDSWTMKAPFPGTHPYRPRGFSQYGFGFFVGGFAGNPATLPWEWAKEVWRYDPNNDSWLRLEDHPGTERRWAVALTIGDRVYYGLGTNGTNFNDWWEFNSLGGFEDDLSDPTFNAYPNPVNDHVLFTSDKHKSFRIDIIDQAGNVVISGEAQNGTVKIDRGSEASGTYMYRLVVQGSTVSSKPLIFL